MRNSQEPGKDRCYYAPSQKFHSRNTANEAAHLLGGSPTPKSRTETRRQSIRWLADAVGAPDNKTQLSMRQRWSRLMPESNWEALLAVRSHTSSALSPLTTASIPPSVRYIPPVPMDPALVDIRHGWSSQLSMSPMSQPTPRRPRFFAHPPSWFLDRDTSSWNPTLRVLFDVRDRGKPIRNSSKDRWEP